MGEAVNPWLHIVAATIWVGPQFFLFIAAIPAVRTIEDAQARARVMRVLTTRFGWLALGAILVLVITGVGNMYEHEVALEDLFDFDFPCPTNRSVRPARRPTCPSLSSKRPDRSRSTEALRQRQA